VALVPQVKSQGITYRGIFTLQSTDQNADQSTDQNVEQSKGNGVARFAGIPFAAPPVGKLRWERPQPLVSGVNSIDATQFAPACMQTGSGLAWYHSMMSRVGVDPSLMQAPEYAEDCLYLNVWTDLRATQKKPVLVFIHGGSNTGGWSYEPNYHGEALASEGVVVVTVAYRLGVFGWLSHPDMSVQNVGLHDLAASLRWVRDHIEDFGGDASRITVSGESAGADNALHLALTPSMQDTIAGVIHQSAGWSATSSLSPQAAFSLGKALVEHHVGPKGRFSDLKSVPADALLDSQQSLFLNHYFSPIRDAETLPVTLETLIKSGDLPAIKLLIGSNLNEALMYLSADASLKEVLDERVPQVAHAKVMAALGLELTERQQLDRLASSLQYTCPSLAIASAVASADGEAWVYRFDRVRDGFDAIGAYHGAELPYVFDRHDAWLPTDQTDKDITQALVGYWRAFTAASGDSINTAAPKAIAWPQWGPTEQILRINDSLRVGPHPDTELCKVLAEANAL
jgi:para-nitrobenzyl esterase